MVTTTQKSNTKKIKKKKKRSKANCKFNLLASSIYLDLNLSHSVLRPLALLLSGSFVVTTIFGSKRSRFFSLLSKIVPKK